MQLGSCCAKWERSVRENTNSVRRVLVYRRRLLPFSETFIRRQILSLQQWEPILIGQPFSQGMSLEDLPVMTVRLSSKSNRIKKTLRSRLRGLFSRDTPNPLAQAQSAARRIAREVWLDDLRRRSPSLLHVHFGTNAEEAWPLAIALGIPIVITLHGYDIATYPEWWESGSGGDGNRNYPAALRALANYGARFVAVSDEILQSALAYGVPHSSLRKILVGIDTRAITPGSLPIVERRRRILFVGRFVEKKGVEYLIRAFADVKQRVADAELKIIGEGPLEPSLRNIAAELQLDIDFAGRMTADDVIREMRFARVLCAPSIRASNGDSEGLPTVIMEAQACGLPVVTSARGGVTEGIIDGITGTAVPERAIDQMADALVNYLQNDSLAAKTSQAARLFAERELDVAIHTQLLEKYYNEIVENNLTSRVSGVF